VIKWCGEEGDDRSQPAYLRHNSPPTDNSSAQTLASGVRGQAPDLRVAQENLTQTVDSGVREQMAVAQTEGEMKGVNDDVWKNILALIKPLNASIEALLRAAKPMAYDGKTLTLGVFYKFHKERLEDAPHRKVLEDVVAKVLKSPTKVVCILVEPPPKKVVVEAKVETVLTEGKDADIIKAAEEIFGN
jgi:hypothetical protein